MTGNVSVRALVAKTHHSGPWLVPDEDPNPDVIFNAAVPDRTFATDGDVVKETVVGYAEMPYNTVVKTTYDYDEFMKYVRDKARYVHIKPEYEGGFEQ